MQKNVNIWPVEYLIWLSRNQFRCRIRGFNCSPRAVVYRICLIVTAITSQVNRKSLTKYQSKYAKKIHQYLRNRRTLQQNCKKILMCSTDCSVNHQQKKFFNRNYQQQQIKAKRLKCKTNKQIYYNKHQQLRMRKKESRLHKQNN